MTRNNEASPDGLCARLRVAIRPLHERVEALPLAQSMVTGKVTLADYTSLLERLAALHRVLERAWDTSDAGALLRSIDRHWFVRSHACERDLAHWTRSAAEPVTSGETAALADELAALLADEPRALLGAIYVSEGSRMGSMVVGRALANTFGLPAATGHGLDYHFEGVERVPARFAALRAELDALVLDGAARNAIERCALRTMTAFHDTFAAPEVVA